jgi:hypothetical protein
MVSADALAVLSPVRPSVRTHARTQGTLSIADLIHRKSSLNILQDVLETFHPETA